ncbi:carbamate kinase [candidate division KSB3 bacterium]|uniref:Carbamate kinase n=1 Tax=candidate division KSB3 bacterium TaxID=2044937 RepID=A0A9D5Q5Q7_9BACT|nr:carbamate kinase [candidate division KSB3 bacterium]MBD3324598.1 carbamate kinase [candidate division KSB3 bacterium]
MRIVVALGGNAISRQDQVGDIPDQIDNCHNTAEHIVDLVEAGHNVIVTHGNGPQVGNILRRVEAARGTVYPLPLDVCGSHSQGGIGYILQREINNVFARRGIDRIAYTLVTQCLVDANDPAFQRPTKPVGPFFTKEQITPMIEHGWDTVEDAGRGYRRVVPSPRPTDIIEQRIIRQVIDLGNVVICCGGGGIPVVKKEGAFQGIEGVIDKDHATSLLARRINADLMVITTGVEKVAVHFNKPDQQFFDRMTVTEARKYYDDGEFPAGSMGPKIIAAIEYIEATGNDVIITLPEKTLDAINGKTGTRIVKA